MSSMPGSYPGSHPGVSLGPQPNQAQPSAPAPAIPLTPAQQASSSLASFQQQNRFPGSNQSAFQPATIGGVGNSVYTVAPATFGGAQVGPVSQFGGAQVGPVSQFGGAQLGPTQTIDPGLIAAIAQGQAPNLSANATIEQIMQGFAPQQQQAQAQLNNQLAVSGLSGGPALAAQNNLNTRMAQALGPTLAAAIQNSQSNQMNQGQFNSNAIMQALTGNASALNSANSTQAGFQQQAGISNAGALNSAAAQQAGLTQQAGLANSGALNSAAAQQAGLTQQAGLGTMDALNAARTMNTGALNSANAANVSASNAAQNNYLNAMMQEWLTNYSAFNSLNDAGLGAQNNIAIQGGNNFGIPSSGSSDAFSGLSSSFGNLFAPTAKAAAAPVTK